MLLFFLRAVPYAFARKVVRITGGRLALVEEEQILDDGAQLASVLTTCNLHQLTFVLQYSHVPLLHTQIQMIE